MPGLLGVVQALVDEDALVHGILHQPVGTSEAVGDVRPVECVEESARSADETVPIAVDAGVVSERRRQIPATRIRNARSVDPDSTNDEPDLDRRAVADACDEAHLPAVGRPHAAEQVDGCPGWIETATLRGGSILANDLAGIGPGPYHGSPAGCGDVDEGERLDRRVELQLVVVGGIVIDAHERSLIEVGVGCGGDVGADYLRRGRSHRKKGKDESDREQSGNLLPHDHLQTKSAPAAGGSTLWITVANAGTRAETASPRLAVVSPSDPSAASHLKPTRLPLFVLAAPGSGAGLPRPAVSPLSGLVDPARQLQGPGPGAEPPGPASTQIDGPAQGTKPSERVKMNATIAAPSSGVRSRPRL